MIQLGELMFWSPKPPSLAYASHTAVPALPSEGWGRCQPLCTWLRAATPGVGLQCSCLSCSSPLIPGSRKAKTERQKRYKAERKRKALSPLCRVAEGAALSSQEQRMELWALGSWRHRGSALLHTGTQTGWDAGPPPCREDRRGWCMSCTMAPV